MQVLFIGDIVGRPGREAIKKLLPKIVKKKAIEFVIANGENAAGGSGITPSICEELLSYGIDVVTSGDHIWKKREIVDYIQSSKNLLRALNYPKGVPGSGSTIVESKSGIKIAVINLSGRVFMQPIECPFKASGEEVKRLKQKTSIIIVDIHAEATSEKIALGWHLDGKVSAVIGTHTHVQTADEKILPNKTAYITDCGMTGPFDGVIGRKKEQILTRFITQMPARFEMAESDVRLNGVVIDVDEKTGEANSIERIEVRL
jgi:metallophosphoesterase (TIGR00282 family)